MKPETEYYYSSEAHCLPQVKIFQRTTTECDLLEVYLFLWCWLKDPFRKSQKRAHCLWCRANPEARTFWVQQAGGCRAVAMNQQMIQMQQTRHSPLLQGTGGKWHNRCIILSLRQQKMKLLSRWYAGVVNCWAWHAYLHFQYGVCFTVPLSKTRDLHCPVSLTWLRGRPCYWMLLLFLYLLSILVDWELLKAWPRCSLFFIFSVPGTL